jgi:excisionase family DNA binding protein
VRSTGKQHTEDLGSKLLVSVEEAAWYLSVSRTMMYDLLASGALRSVRVKRLRLIPMAELQAFVQALLAA